ncbi:MAG: Glycine betaine transport ATP-binding protein OpuAA [Chlamydiae bacterium]|nr:Glycine betaine transport ATP-binding protein OpuAA [Chlamydiota bacterium]
MLRVNDVHFAYESKKLLNGISFELSKSEIVSLIGLSGSGKTTLFRLISGLISPDQGIILIDGQQLPEGAELITYMHQKDLLLPWRNVVENMLLFSELGRRNEKKNLENEALVLLERMGLKGCENLYPDELSGGMKQRVALARALLQNRPILLLDEPFGSLDVIVREELYGLLTDIRKNYGKTILLVTHDFRDALTLSDRILLLSEGRISHQFEIEESQKEQIEEEIRAKLQPAATF